MRTVQFELLRPGEIVEERNKRPLVYVPIGPLEWHSLHLPMGTDPLNATEVAHQLAQRIGGVVLPTFYWGTERERTPDVATYLGFDKDDYVFGMNFPGHILKSMYCREEFFALLVRELIVSLIGLEYKLIVLVNGHGALNHVDALERLCKEFTSESPVTVHLANALLKGTYLGYTCSHAAAVETSNIMALHPESVDMNQLPPHPEPLGYQEYGMAEADAWHGNPTADYTVKESSDPRLHASAELGQKFIEKVVNDLEDPIREKLKLL